MSQTLFCWIWGLTYNYERFPVRMMDVTNLILLDLRSDRLWPKFMGKDNDCHKPYFVGFEVWPSCRVETAANQSLSQTLFCWIWGLTNVQANIIGAGISHKPYFVGFEVWLGGFLKQRNKSWGHKPYFVGFEVWLEEDPMSLDWESLSQTLFCWIWGLTIMDISHIGGCPYVTNLILLDLRSDHV